MTEFKRKVPPDGGYGWTIVFANALSNFIIVPLIQCFGLLFKDTFAELRFTATQESFIINLNGAFGMIAGLLIGVLLKIYGCRKIACFGAFLLTLGVAMTAYSTTFMEFVISYGIITSLGMWVSESSYGLALNLYFKERRSKAMGIAVTVTGFGPIIIPQLINYLLKICTVREVTMIYAGICANVFTCAILLHPVEWHWKEVSSAEEEPLKIEEKPEKAGDNKAELSMWRKFVASLVKIFDLDLLKDPIFVNIMVGMSLAIFAEMNFTVLTPFILDEYELTTDEIATFLSTLGVTDIIFRFFAPYIGEFFTQPPRLMYVFALFLLIITRFTFILSSNNFYCLLLVALGLGVAKGIRKVYMALVIPAHVPLEKLSSAAGMELMGNGICVLIGGPLIGLVKDLTHSYSLSIVVMNCVTFTCIIMWSIEAVISKCRERNKVEKRDEMFMDGFTNSRGNPQ